MQAAELQRYSIYFDTGRDLWKKDIEWKKLKLWQWDKLFQPGISAVPPRGMDDPQHTYILRPVGAELTYIRRGSNIKRKENEPIQDLVLKISSVSLHVSRESLRSLLILQSSQQVQPKHRLQQSFSIPGSLLN